MNKPVIATASLAGCFGCHMSLLDIDDRILKLIDLVEFHKSPIDDIKTFRKPCDVGLIEGGCCNTENVENLRTFRKNCKILVAVGECAIMGGLPALRNGIPVRECLEEAYRTGPTVDPGSRVIPGDEDLPDHPGPRLSPARDRQDRRLPARLSAAGRPHLGGPDGHRRGPAPEPDLQSPEVRLKERPMARKITIEPITRVEGHGKVTILLDDKNRVERTRLHIVEFRGFERFVQGRPYWEAPVLVQRLCGICPVSHHLAAAKAMDAIVGVGPEGLSPTAEKMRRLMHYAQMFQSHALHFFHLASPDLLFGADADPAIRNVIGVVLYHKELATRAVLLRKFGQEIILATAGKKIHGTGAIPGGINKNLTAEERDVFLKGPVPLDIDTMITWALEAVEFFKDFHRKNKDLIDGFAAFPSNHLSLVRKDGGLDFYHGPLRAVDAEGHRILDDVDYVDYLKYIGEDVKTWSYMKFPYLRSLGKEDGWYRVGPLARLNCCEFIPSPLAQHEYEIFKAYTGGKPNGMSLHTHWARLIELLHAGEVIKELLNDPDLQKDDLTRKGTQAI